MIGDTIRYLREQAGYSQSELAKRLGVTRSSVNAWESGLSAPTAVYIIELSKLFHIRYERKGAEPSLSMEEVYANQLAALEKAMEIRDSLHQNGKIKDGMSEKQIAQAYYNYLVGLNVRPGGGSEAAAKGQSVEYDTAYACLVNKRGDCVGRAAAFNLLMHVEGISAQGVAGNIIGTGSGHVLSRVVLDGEEHFCDWGSSKKGIYKDISNWFEFETESLEAARAVK